MPTGSDWIKFTYVNLCFIIQIIIIYTSLSLINIQDNWAVNRNNPLFLIFSNNPEQDFSYLVQNIQTNYMGYLLEPLNFITSNLGNMGGLLTDSLNDVRNVISNIRTFLATLTQNIYGVFLNIVIEFQKIIIKIKDLVQKLVAIMAVLLNIVSTSIDTMESGWNGPGGQMVRDIGNFACFHPDTLVKLHSGKICKIKNLKLGDIIENGSKVNATLKLAKGDQDIYYRFSHGVNGSNIYVTGMHLIFYKEKYIYVKDHPDAIIEKNMETEYVSSLITSDHKIQIGKILFHDWDDDYIHFSR